MMAKVRRRRTSFKKELMAWPGWALGVEGQNHSRHPQSPHGYQKFV